MVLLFISELGLRFLYPEKALQIANQDLKIKNLAFQYHSEYLIDLKPSVQKQYPGCIVEWQTNKDGFRGHDLVPQPKLRVMVYGDSNILARFSTLEASFAGRLEQYLKQMGKDEVEVINAGVVGFGPDQSLIKLTTGIDRYRPHIIVFHVFADNDFGDMIRNRLFELDGDGELIETDFKRTVDPSIKRSGSRLLVVRAAAAAFIRLGLIQAPKDPIVSDASVWTNARFIKTQIDIIRQEFEVYKRGEAKQFSHFADHYDIDIALHPETESATIKIALMEALLKRVSTIAARNNTKLVVLIQPSSRDLTRNSQPNYEHFSQYPNYRRDRLTSIVDDICKRHHIPRINLFPLFMENNPTSLYFERDNNHWNDKGQDLAAYETARFIFQNFD